MKEITRIHLAALPYNIEVDAKKLLEKYLASIEQSLSADEDAMREIEARMAEILTERGVTGEKVIVAGDIGAIIEQLGKPTDFADENTVAQAHEEPRAPKRLMRDTHNGTLGGICAGLAAYWDVSVTWLRLLAVFLIFATSGVAIPFYLVMWWVIPPARTASERLAMTGRAATLETLQDETNQMAEQPANSRIVVDALRMVIGVGLLVAVGLAVIGLVAATVFTSDEVFASRSWRVIISASIIGVAWLSAIGSGIVATYMFLANKFMKTLGILLLVLAMMSGILFGVGGVGLYEARDIISQRYQAEHSSTEMLDTTPLVGAKRLIVKSDVPLSISYTSSAIEPLRAEVHYNKRKYNEAPNIRFIRDGDSVEIVVNNARKMCMNAGCREGGITITGGILDAIEVSDIEVSYIAMQPQKSLNITTRDTASVNVTTSFAGPLEQLHVTATGNSVINAREANIKNLVFVAEDARARLEAARVLHLEATIPETCASGTDRGGIELEGVQEVIVNGRIYEPNKTYPCMAISIQNI